MNRFVLSATTAVLNVPAVAVAEVSELPSPYPYPEPAWPTYLVGAGIGLLVLVTLSLAGKKVGASSAYADLAGLIGRLVAPRHVRNIPYWRDDQPQIGWTLVFVLGAVGGSFLAAWTGGELTGTYLQPLWEARFGTDSAGLRTLLAFAGGAVMAYGARLAGGCTSGHGISGTLQLAVGSWVAVACFFVGGIATALLLYWL